MEEEILDTGHSQQPVQIYSSIGGWLVLPVIGLFLVPFVTVFGIYQKLMPLFSAESLANYDTSDSDFLLMRSLLCIEVFINIGFIVYCIFILFKVFQYKKVVPKLFIIYYASHLSFILIDALVVSTLDLGVDVWEASGKNIMRGAVACAIWIPYFVKSERVKGTFVR